MPNCLPVGQPGPLFDGFFVEGKSPVWMSHGDHVARVPDGFEVVAGTANAPVCAIQDVSTESLRGAVSSRGQSYAAR